MPFMVNYLLIFYIIFECICNAFAEFTRWGQFSGSGAASQMDIDESSADSLIGLSTRTGRTYSPVVGFPAPDVFMLARWNSTSFDEFSRRWNKPVHSFLLRHVYASTISAYKISKFQAAFVTFFLSALVHELVMAIVTKKIRMYLFLMQVSPVTWRYFSLQRRLVVVAKLASIYFLGFPYSGP